VADGLSKLISKKVESQALQELHICRGAPGISHLLFGDDTMLFFRASVGQANTIKDILDTYTRCTCQLINPGKCSILFNEKGRQGVQEQVKQVLGVEQSTLLSIPEGKIEQAIERLHGKEYVSCS
jgi:hypothetical protein